MASKKIEVNAFCLHDGQYVFNDVSKLAIKNFIEDHAGDEIQVVFDADKTRSKMQNAFFHASILPAIQRILIDSGIDNAVNKEWVKQIIIKKPYLTVNHGTKDEYVRSTTDLTVNEFWLFLNYCIELLLNLGGRLNNREEEQFIEIIKKFKLETTIDNFLIKNNT